MFSKKKIAETAQEFADFLEVTGAVRSLQDAQKVLANAVDNIGARVRDLEADMRVLRAEARLDALRETQQVVNAVQGGLNQRLEELSIRVAMLERGVTPRLVAPSPTDGGGGGGELLTSDE